MTMQEHIEKLHKEDPEIMKLDQEIERLKVIKGVLEGTVKIIKK